MDKLFLLFLPLPLLAACGQNETRNATEIAAGNIAADAPTAANNGNAPAPAPVLRTMAVGPLQIRYDAALLTPLRAKVAIPPDWKTEVDGLKLLARDRAELVGKAECIYGQSGKASRCNVSQEAGLSFASLEIPFADLGAKLPADQRKPISLAGVTGFSWEIGAEGEGAEYILLPMSAGADAGTVLIVRQFRTSGNPDERALGAALADLKLDAPG
jgi:hypothetical protein